MDTSLLIPSVTPGPMTQPVVLQIPFHGYDSFPIAASVISANPTATTLSLACPTPTGDSEDDFDCGLFPTHVLTIGPSTYHIDMNGGPGEASDSFTGTEDCKTTSTAGASKIVCIESAGGSGANFPGVETTTYDTDGKIPVTVTKGMELLKAAAEATPTKGSGGKVEETGSSSAAGQQTGGSQTGSAAQASSTGAAAVNSVGLFGVVAGLLGGLLF